MSRFQLVLFAIGCLLLPLPAFTADEFTTAEDCQQCHQQQYQQWQQSDHYRSMQLPTPDSVLGDFGDKTVSFHDVEYRFFRAENQYWLEIKAGKAEPDRYPIRYVFGFFPLQQYLLDIGDGHLQALNVAWDSRPEDQGGQRWFHLREDEEITARHPFHWRRHFQNWNSRCAECHSTNLEKNYNPAKHSYNTVWSEINVSCDACHGSGKKHIELAEADELSPANSGFKQPMAEPLRWQFKPGAVIAEPAGEATEARGDYLNQCGSCHALRTQIGEDAAGQSFHDSNRLQLANTGTYFVDGQVREEAFVVGSFLQSKMYQKGVSCGNCHNSHTGKVQLQGNELCSQCHLPARYDTVEHHHHPAGSEGAACVNCHMPQRTFMGVDARRDHSFTIPRPTLSAIAGVPNACVSCHQEKQNVADWARQQFDEWGVEPNRDHWGYINYRAQNRDVLISRAMAKAVSDRSLPPLVRASLLDQFALLPSQMSFELARHQLKNSDPLLRRAAVSALQPAPPPLRWQILSPHLQDDSRLVRYQLAQTLADVLHQLPDAERQKLMPLIDEYRASLALSEDSPATQLAIASLELGLGEPEKALAAYRQALRIEPDFVPALLNLAEFYRVTGEENKSLPLYRQALEVAPDSGAANHSYGLFLIRQKQHQAALPYLKAAVAQADAQPRFAFVYAVALDSQGQTQAAVDVLTAAAARWPNQYDSLLTLIHYLEKTGNTQPIYQHLSALSAIAPAAPEVRRLVQKYTGNSAQE